MVEITRDNVTTDDDKDGLYTQKKHNSMSK